MFPRWTFSLARKQVSKSDARHLWESDILLIRVSSFVKCHSTSSNCKRVTWSEACPKFHSFEANALTGHVVRLDPFLKATGGQVLRTGWVHGIESGYSKKGLHQNDGKKGWPPRICLRLNHRTDRWLSFFVLRKPHPYTGLLEGTYSEMESAGNDDGWISLEARAVDTILHFAWVLENHVHAELSQKTDSDDSRILIPRFSSDPRCAFLCSAFYLAPWREFC